MNVSWSPIIEELNPEILTPLSSNKSKNGDVVALTVFASTHVNIEDSYLSRVVSSAVTANPTRDSTSALRPTPFVRSLSNLVTSPIL